MRVISRRTIKEFWEKKQFANAEEPLRAWYAEARSAAWTSWLDIRDKYSNASILKGGRVVFNILGNKYRLVTKVEYRLGLIFIKFIGTHREYDRIDANTT